MNRIALPKTMTKDEKVYLALESLFETYGYRKFKMRRFETYALYEEFKSFLLSEYILTFSSPEGKLMALRPDVTLSIVKNTRADEEHSDKVYYRENVYRMDRHSKEYREIPQAGVELIGKVDAAATLEIICMAKQCLEIIDPVSILCLSHMGFVEGILEACKATDPERAKILHCLRTQNVHDLYAIVGDREPRCGWLADLAEALISRNCYEETLALSRKIAVNDRMTEALNELTFIGSTLTELGLASGIRLDFTMQSDLNYYNGILMQGYVEQYPGAILTGGRYDRLLTKFQKNLSALGFALSLGDLNSCYPNLPEYDADVLLLYSSKNSPASVLQAADALRKEGKRVHLSENAPKGFSAKEIIDLRKEGSSC